MKNISVFYLVQIALKYLYILMISAVVFGIAAFAFCKFVAVPRYSAKGSVIVTNGAITSDDTNSLNSGNKVNNADVVASLQLKPTVIDILKTNNIYKELAERYTGKYTYAQLTSVFTVASRNDSTLFIDISVTASTGEEALQLVNDFLELAPDYIVSTIPSSKADIYLADNSYKTYPRTFTTVIASAFAGAVLAYLIVFAIAMLNNTINTEEDLSENYDIPVLGNIPDFTNAKNQKGYYKNNYYYSKRSGAGYGDQK